jgi:transcriptional regulator with XRE-family HTH domain
LKNQQLADNLRTLRNYKNYTQQYVAKKLNVSQPDYSDIENGKTKLSEDKQKIIEALYDLPPFIINELSVISLLQHLLFANKETESKTVSTREEKQIMPESNRAILKEIDNIEQGIKFLKNKYYAIQFKIG